MIDMIYHVYYQLIFLLYNYTQLFIVEYTVMNFNYIFYYRSYQSYNWMNMGENDDKKSIKTTSSEESDSDDTQPKSKKLCKKFLGVGNVEEFVNS